MAAPTAYTVFIDGTSGVWTSVPADSDTANHPALRQNAVFGLMNQTGSGKIVRVVEVRQYPRNSSVTGSAPVSMAALFTVQRITAHSGGPLLSWFAHNQSGSPTGVNAMLSPASITTTGAPYRKSVWSVPQWGGSTVFAPFAMTAMHRGLYRGGYSGDTSAEVQSILLRASEGMAIIPASRGAIPYPLRVEIMVSDSQDSYIASAIVTGEERAWMSVLCDSGNLGVRAVSRISVEEYTAQQPSGTSAPAMAQVEIIEGMTEGDIVSAVSHDQNSGLPSGIDLRLAPIVMMAGASSGALIAKPLVRRIPMGVEATPLSTAAVPMNLGGGRTANALGDADLWLREGRGMALMIRTPSITSLSDFSVTFTTEPAASGASSSGGSWTWMG